MMNKKQKALKPISKILKTKKGRGVLSLPKKYTERAVDLPSKTEMTTPVVESPVPQAPRSDVNPNYGKGLVPGQISVKVVKHGGKFWYEPIDSKYSYLKIFPIERQDDLEQYYQEGADFEHTKVLAIKLYSAEQQHDDGTGRKLEPGEVIDCEGKLVKALDCDNQIMKSIMTILYDHGVSIDLDEEDLQRVLSEYEKFHDVSENDPDDPLSIANVKARVSNFLDARSLPFIVIDPGSEDKTDVRNRSGDHDDATYTEKHPDGSFTQYTAIAATSLYVLKDSEIQKSALKRMITYYIFDLVAPLFLPRLSNDLCSFNEGMDRFAVITIQQFDKDGFPKLDERGNEIVDIRLGVINPRYSTVYSSIDKVFAGDAEAMSQYSPEVLESLFALKDLNERLSSHRLSGGEARFRTAERRYILNKDRSGVDQVLVERSTISKECVATTMLESNRTNAAFAFANDIPFIWRVEPCMNPIKIQQMKAFCARKGFAFDYDEENARSGDIQRAISKVVDQAAREKGNLFSDVFNEFLITHMEKAYDSTKNIGHFALHLLVYAHLSAGIRRFVDTANQTNLIAYMEGKPAPYNNEELQKIADLANFAERNADAIKQALDALAHVDDIGKRLAKGEDLSGKGYISKVEPERLTVLTEYGKFVVDLREHDGKTAFSLSLDRLSISNGRRTYEIGQELEINPTKVHYEDRTVEAEITNTLEEAQTHENYMDIVYDFYNGGGGYEK